jgi:dihydrofolate synthase/folylpolyglutamate synthase
MLAALLRPGDRAAIVPIPDHASWSAAALAASCPGAGAQLSAVASVAEGLAWLLAPAGGAAAVPVVAGSLYLIGAVLPWLDPAGGSQGGGENGG